MHIQHIVPAARYQHAGITEIVLSGATTDKNEIVMPMLAHLSKQTEDRWFTWIMPKEGSARVPKQILQHYGFDLSKLRIIYASDQQETLWILWDVLQNGNSDTVVASPDIIGEKDFSKLEQAAFAGNTRGLMLRHR